MTNCPDLEALERWIAGGPTPGSDAIASHLATCSRCQTEADAVRRNLEIEGRVIAALTSDGELSVSFEATAEAEPKRLGRFQILGELGRGAMGRVYAGHDPALGRDVAIKLLPPASKTPRDIIEREARLLASINHPHIATIYSLEHDGPRIFLVLERIRGVSLRSLLDQRSLPVDHSILFGRQIASALEAAHERGIVHRDLKPSNVMITDDGRAKVLDFGIACFIGSESDPSGESVSFAGTPAYMSPEQITGGTIDERSDLWALGCVLYECFVGRSLFGRDSPRERIEKALNRTRPEVDLPNTVAPAIAQLVRSCLSPSPEERPGSAADIRIQLEEGIVTRSRISAPVMGASTTANAGPHNLPVPRTGLIGRQIQLRDLLHSIETTRLTTLHGAGGAGKTRLALEAAYELRAEFPDGVWWIDWTALQSESHALDTLAGLLGLPPSRATRPHVSEALGARCALFVFDNCEASLESAGSLASSIVQSGLESRILATSREPLRSPFEKRMAVGPLACIQTDDPSPGDLYDSEAERLFLERIREHTATTSLTKKDAAAIVRICRALDGLPLALELAAAKTRVLDLEQIEARLSQRFRLLTSRVPGGLPHHQTLESMVDWSVDRLERSERELLLRLAVFRDRWSIEAAEAICSNADLDKWDIPDLVASLLDRSLIERETVRIGNESRPRFRLLETIRSYAEDRLPKSLLAELRANHCNHYLDWLDTGTPLLHSAREPEWLDKIQAEETDLRMALRYCLDRHRAEPAARLVRQLLRFWEVRGRWHEARATCETILASETLAPRDRAEILIGAGGIASVQGDRDVAHAQLESGLRLAGELSDHQLMGRAQHRLASHAFQQSQLREAQTRYRAALRECRLAGDGWAEAAILNNLGAVAGERSCLTRSTVLLSAALEIRRRIGDKRGMAMSMGNLANAHFHGKRLEQAESLALEAWRSHDALGNAREAATQIYTLGRIALARGDSVGAKAHYLESLRRRREIGDVSNQAASQIGLGHLAWQDGELEDARHWFFDAVSLYASAGNVRWASRALTWAGLVAAEEGHALPAAQLLACAASNRERLGDASDPEEAEKLDRAARSLETQLGTTSYQRTRDLGASSSMEEVISYAQSQTRSIQPRVNRHRPDDHS